MKTSKFHITGHLWGKVSQTASGKVFNVIGGSHFQTLLRPSRKETSIFELKKCEWNQWGNQHFSIDNLDPLYANAAISTKLYRRFVAFCGLYKSLSRISSRIWHWSIHVIGPVPVQYSWRIWMNKVQDWLNTFYIITVKSSTRHRNMNMGHFVTLLSEEIQHNQN